MIIPRIQSLDSVYSCVSYHVWLDKKKKLLFIFQYAYYVLRSTHERNHKVKINNRYIETYYTVRAKHPNLLNNFIHLNNRKIMKYVLSSSTKQYVNNSQHLTIWKNKHSIWFRTLYLCWFLSTQQLFQSKRYA